jgi:hypothetical protein
VKSRDRLTNKDGRTPHQYRASKHTSFGLCTLGVKICVHNTYIRIKRDFTFVFLSTWTVFLVPLSLVCWTYLHICIEFLGNQRDTKQTIFSPFGGNLTPSGEHDGDWFSLVKATYTISYTLGDRSFERTKCTTFLTQNCIIHLSVHMRPGHCWGW